MSDRLTEHFTRAELASRDGVKSPYTLEVRPQLLELLEKIRRAWNAPILVNCAYRSPKHNKEVGGVENSYHVKGLAADIRPEHKEDLPEFQQLCSDLNKGGGVGYYDTFCHVDARGFYSRWDARSALNKNRF